MDQLDSMRSFVRVVDEGGFAAAARSLGRSRSVVNRAVIALETALGTPLLRRSTRQVSPTDAGALFYERALPILAQVDAAMGAVAELRSEPTGTLRVNAPMSFGTGCLSPIAAAFLARYPEIRLEMMLSDRYVDPIEEGFDVTLRVGAPSHSTSLAGRALAEIPVVLCAAPAYLAAADAPRDPGDLRLHRCLHYGYLASGSQWRFREPNGADRTVRINCVMWSNNGEVLRDAALAGTGIALLPTFIVGDALAAGALVPLLREYERPPLELTALSPRHRQQAAKIALFTEFVAAELSLPSWLGSADQAGGAPA